MIETEIYDIIKECFSTSYNNEYIIEKIDRIIIGNSSNIPDMIDLYFKVINIDKNIKPIYYNKDSFIIQHNNVYCWINYYRTYNNLIDICINGYLNLNDILIEM